MWLLVGLGNPEASHARNRHNIGFMAVDAIVHRHGFEPWHRNPRFRGLIAEGSLGGQRVIALKPLTYMNLSGESVGAALRFYKLEPAVTLVLHDELDLPAGRLRTKRGGGNGGHNGLRSIDAHIGPDYRRVRLGIGHPGHKDRVTGHVLGDFGLADRAWLDPMLDAVALAAPLLLAPDEAAFANRVSLALAGPGGKPTAASEPHA